MSYIVEIIVSDALENHVDLDAFETAVRLNSDPDVDILILASIANADLEAYDKVFAEDTEYTLTSTFTWKDEATYLTASSNPSIQDNQTTLETTFTVVRNLP